MSRPRCWRGSSATPLVMIPRRNRLGTTSVRRSFHSARCHRHSTSPIQRCSCAATRPRRSPARSCIRTAVSRRRWAAADMAGVQMGFDVPTSTLASGVEVHHGVEFATVEGYRPLLLDLYLPAPATGSGAAIVYMHGGGWAVGTRRRFGRAFIPWSPTPLDLLARAGFVVATVDYRLSGEAHFPAQLHDVKAAVRWVRGNARTLGVDIARIVAWGESAGGHLAMLAGLTGHDTALDGEVGAFLDESSAVSGVIYWV